MMQDAFGEEEDSGHSSKKHHSKDKDKGKKQKVMELIEKAEKDGIELPPTATDKMSQDQIQSLLAETMKQIETRKKKVQEAVRNKTINYICCLRHEVMELTGSSVTFPFND